MSPIQQMLLGVGAVATKTYVDDVFNTFLYTGTGSSGNAISNGINLSGEGGLVWAKNRGTSSRSHILFDSEIGDKYLRSDVSNEAADFYGQGALNSSGFTVGGDWGTLNASGENFSSWTFRKAPGFFDVVTYTGNNTNGRTVSHSLGCVPGMILIKRSDYSGANWVVYHRSTDDTEPANYRLRLNTTMARSGGYFNNTEPTASVFTLGTDSEVNGNGGTYVAYVFAGGEDPTTATARSVDFDGTDDYLSIPDHADYELGSNDFTLECWVKTSVTSSDYRNVFGKWQGSGQFSYMIRSSKPDPADGWVFFYSTTGSPGGHTIVESGVNIHDGQWHHLAVTRTGGKVRLFTDGNLSKEENITATIYNSTAPVVIASDQGDQWFTGKISNVRIVNGTAVYTSAFRPPTEPLTNVTNTKLLCCNNSSVTGSTVCTGTITAGSSPTASTDSPFDDPAGFVFGDAGDQNVIKCGSYVGNGSATGPEINLGWEPQYLLIKNSSATQSWWLFDSMRGIVSGGDDKFFTVNTNDSDGNANRVSLTPTGFKCVSASADLNGNGNTMIYMAIRRSDGYVGKPADAGTDVFSMDAYGTSNGSPSYVSSMSVVDMAMMKKPTATSSWFTTARLVQGTRGKTDSSDAFAAYANTYDFDFQNGWSYFASAHEYQSWMWKRHAGFDVVAYTGTGAARTISHSMNAVPQMMWIKNREDSGYPWYVYHSGTADSGMGYGYLDKTDAWSSAGLGGAWNSTAPTSTVFSLGTWAGVNYSGSDYIAMLFASVDGISKVGSYTGSGSSGNAQNIGFQPRFLIIKRSDSNTNAEWNVMDTVRGLGAGNEKILYINATDDQLDSNQINISSTGFGFEGSGMNISSATYIYYAHA